MANSQLQNENSDDDEMTRRNRPHRRASTDGLEFVPTILKWKQMIVLRHSDLLRLLEEFNNTLEIFTRDEQHYLRFTIVPHSDSTIFWKAIIRIKCSKISRIDQSSCNEVVLNLHQFLSVHQSLSQQMSILQKYPALYNSSTTNENSSSFSTAKLSFPIPSDNECCICMDRQPNLVLPCTHKFCDECFQQWFSQTSVTSSQTCPLCREDMTSDSGFLLAETPKYDHVKKTLAESILSLPVDYKTRSNDGHSSLRHPRE